MKKIIVVAFLFSLQFIEAQNDISLVPAEVHKNDTLVYDRKGLEVEPQFPGGIQKFYAFFNSNFKIGSYRMRKGERGRKREREREKDREREVFWGKDE